MAKMAPQTIIIGYALIDISTLVATVLINCKVLDFQMNVKVIHDLLNINPKSLSSYNIIRTLKKYGISRPKDCWVLLRVRSSTLRVICLDSIWPLTICQNFIKGGRQEGMVDLRTEKHGICVRLIASNATIKGTSKTTVPQLIRQVKDL